ncbi:restriction endonuclease subunit S [Niveibacterium sp.]|uniref:restriction endonuclease subunit S n=1 Tax=Niveibacterium sp. TaxID=2017444 RepID=UPI0035AE5662
MSDKKNKNLRLGWRQVRFGDVVRQCKEKADPETSGLDRYIAGDHMDTDDLRLRRWGEIGSGYLGPAFHMRFKPGQVLYGSRRTYLRKVAVADFEGICANTTFVLEPKIPQEFLPEFLPFVMQTEAFHAFSIKKSKGSVNPYINFSDLAGFEFALPPVDEQIRLVELLSTAHDSADACASALDAAKLLLRSGLVSVFAAEGCTPDRAEMSPASIRPGWRLPSAKDISVAPITKGATPTSATGSLDTGIPFLKVYNLTFDGSLDFSVDPTFVTSHVHAKELARSQVQGGDVLMNIVGPPLGKVSIVPSDFPSANINQAIARFRIRADIPPRYFAAYLLSDWAQRWLQARSKKTSGQQNLTLELCQTLPVPLPPDHQLEEVVSAIDALVECVRRVEKRKSAAALMYKSVLTEVFGDV